MELILTRYLYPKHNVIYSLYISLFLNDTKMALFWAYELYYSGFRTETIDLLLDTFDTYYIQDKIKPKLKEWLNKRYELWKQNMNLDSIIRIFIENIIRRELDYQKVLDFIPNIESNFDIYTNKIISQKSIFIIFREDSAKEYQTIMAQYAGGWKIPRQVCTYQSIMVPNSHRLNITNYQNWLYFAYGSPIWRTRIKKYGGKINENKKTVLFPNEDYEVEFHNIYDLEPDEQPIEIQNAWFGLYDGICDGSS